MARIFKPRYAVRRMVTGPDGTKRYAPVLDKQGKPVYRETANWYIETRVNSRLKKVPGYTDKAATLQLAAKLVKQEAHRNQGLIPEGTESLTLPLEQHLADWLEALKSEASEAHARQQHTRAKRVIDGCGFDLWRDIRREKVAQYLARIQLDADGKAGLSRRTADFYLQAVKQFLGWLVESERAPFSPLANVRRKKKSKRAKYILRHPRRPFSDDELRQLIAVTKTGNEPARISVKKDGQTWEVTEKELDKLPPDIRPHVERMLGGTGPIDIESLETPSPWFGGEPKEPRLPGRIRPDLQKQLEKQQQQLEKLQKQLEELKKSLEQIGPAAPEQGVPESPRKGLKKSAPKPPVKEPVKEKV